MSLRNPSISRSALAKLYGSNLIGEPQHSAERIAEKPSTVPTTDSFRYLGNNEKNIVVICSYADEAMLPDTDLQFLTKMLGACKLSLADVAIVNVAKSPADLEVLKSRLKAVTILLFGVDPVSLKIPLQFPAFKVQGFDGINLLAAPAIGELNQDGETGKQFKARLWTSLKQLFNI